MTRRMDQLIAAARWTARPASVAARAGALAQFERRGNLCSLGAVAYDLGTRPAAGDQLQRVHEDGLACAGLAGQHREPRAQLQLDGVDDGEIADLQVREHAGLSALEAAAPPMELRS